MSLEHWRLVRGWTRCVGGCSCFRCPRSRPLPCPTSHLSCVCWGSPVRAQSCRWTWHGPRCRAVNHLGANPGDVCKVLRPPDLHAENSERFCKHLRWSRGNRAPDAYSTCSHWLSSLPAHPSTRSRTLASWSCPPDESPTQVLFFWGNPN